MITYIKYAYSQYFTWLGYFGTVTGLVAFVSFDEKYNFIERVIVIACFVLAFMIPFIIAMIRCNFKIKTVGKSNILFEFGDLFKEKCFVITTNRHFDVIPTGELIAPDSLLGIYVNKYFENNTDRLESLISEQLGSEAAPHEYGKTIKIQHNDKIVYLLVFTDRKKTEQPKDFYEKSLKGLFEYIVNENHDETIAIPLIGDNNNLSNSGFNNSAMTFECLMAVINSFEIRHQTSGIKLKIVASHEKRAELIKSVYSYSS